MAGSTNLGSNASYSARSLRTNPHRNGRAGWSRADGGTVLLDEISALSPHLAKTGSLHVHPRRRYRTDWLDAGDPGQCPVHPCRRVRTSPRSSSRENFAATFTSRINNICLKLPSLAQRGDDIMTPGRIRFSRKVSASEFRQVGRRTSPPTRSNFWPGTPGPATFANSKASSSAACHSVKGPRINSNNLAVGITPTRTSRPAPGNNYSPKAFIPPRALASDHSRKRSKNLKSRSSSRPSGRSTGTDKTQRGCSTSTGRPSTRR